MIRDWTAAIKDDSWENRLLGYAMSQDWKAATKDEDPNNRLLGYLNLIKSNGNEIKRPLMLI